MGGAKAVFRRRFNGTGHPGGNTLSIVAFATRFQPGIQQRVVVRASREYLWRTPSVSVYAEEASTSATSGGYPPVELPSLSSAVCTDLRINAVAWPETGKVVTGTNVGTVTGDAAAQSSSGQALAVQRIGEVCRVSRSKSSPLAAVAMSRRRNARRDRTVPGASGSGTARLNQVSEGGTGPSRSKAANGHTGAPVGCGRAGPCRLICSSLPNLIRGGGVSTFGLPSAQPR